MLGSFMIPVCTVTGSRSSTRRPPADSDEKAAIQPLQQMIARHLLDPNTAIPTDNAKLRAAVSSPSFSCLLSHLPASHSLKHALQASLSHACKLCVMDSPVWKWPKLAIALTILK